MTPFRLPPPTLLPLAAMGLTLTVVGAFAALAPPPAGGGAVLLAAAGAALILAGGLGWLLGRTLTGPLDELGRSMQAVARRDYETPIAGLDRADALGAMAAALADLRDMLREADAAKAEREAIQGEQERIVAELGRGLTRLAEGDLRTIIDAQFPATYEPLRNDFNRTLGTLSAIVAAVVTSATSIRDRAHEISSSSDDLSRRTDSQAAALEQTAAALGELTSGVAAAAARVTEVETVVGEARSDAERSGSVVCEAVAAMSEIKRSSDEISQIIGVIDDIAFQTNLLALNAGVEAARAGEAGRGFAVVASEVRSLAQRSSDAARQIKSLIEGSAKQVQEGVSLVGRAGTALTSIIGAISDISSLVSEIAVGAKEQSTGIGEINIAVTQLDQVTQQNATMVEEATRASHALSQDASHLGEMVAQFHLVEDKAETNVIPLVKPSPATALALEPRPPIRAARAANADGWEEF